MNCSQLWIGALRQIEAVATPELQVSPMSGSALEDSIRARIAMPCVHYLAPHTGCGCGFEVLEIKDSPLDALARASCAQLEALLHEVVARDGGAVLYSACDDAISATPTARHVRTVDGFMRDINRLRATYGSEDVVLIELVPETGRPG